MNQRQEKIIKRARELELELDKYTNPSDLYSDTSPFTIQYSIIAYWSKRTEDDIEYRKKYSKSEWWEWIFIKPLFNLVSITHRITDNLLAYHQTCELLLVISSLLYTIYTWVVFFTGSFIIVGASSNHYPMLLLPILLVFNLSTTIWDRLKSKADILEFEKEKNRELQNKIARLDNDSTFLLSTIQIHLESLMNTCKGNMISMQQEFREVFIESRQKTEKCINDLQVKRRIIQNIPNQELKNSTLQVIDNSITEQTHILRDTILQENTLAEFFKRFMNTLKDLENMINSLGDTKKQHEIIVQIMRETSKTDNTYQDSKSDRNAIFSSVEINLKEILDLATNIRLTLSKFIQSLSSETKLSADHLTLPTHQETPDISMVINQKFLSQSPNT